jgi:hypothetical protein
LVEESATSVDLSSAGLLYLAALQEAASASDSVFPSFLWNVIDDTQNANWGNIGTAQNPNWGAIDDSQNAAWAALETV